MIVVDSNVVAYLYLPGDLTPRSESLLENDPDWAVPLLWRSEMRNILAGYMRRGTLNRHDAQQVQLEAESLLTGGEYEVDSHLVLKLVDDSDCSAYDCEFVALAITLGVKLVTMDAKLLKAFPRQTASLAGS